MYMQEVNGCIMCITLTTYLDIRREALGLV